MYKNVGYCGYLEEGGKLNVELIQLGQENEKLKQTLAEINEIAKEQIPYFNIDKAKTMIEIEYDYTGKIYNLEQRMYKILQKISEVLND